VSFDLIYSGIATTLAAHIATLPVADRPDFHRDFFRQFPDEEDGGHVFLYTRMIRQLPGGGRGRYYKFMAQYFVDCVYASKGLLLAGTYTKGDERAGKQLRVLVGNMIEGLFNYQGINLGLAPAEIGSRPFPQIDFFEPGGENAPERSVLGARLTVEVEATYEPGGISGPPLSAVGVSHPLFEADVYPEEVYEGYE
jgi:hypothetical protein